MQKGDIFFPISPSFLNLKSSQYLITISVSCTLQIHFSETVVQMCYIKVCKFTKKGLYGIGFPVNFKIFYTSPLLQHTSEWLLLIFVMLFFKFKIASYIWDTHG